VLHLRGHASLVHVPLPKGAGDHLKSEKYQNEKKRAPAETRHESGGGFFIHLGCSFVYLDFRFYFLLGSPDF
jgi:hypothetical protein